MLPSFGAYTGGLDVRSPAIARHYPQGGHAFLLGRDRVFCFSLSARAGRTPRGYAGQQAAPPGRPLRPAAASTNPADDTCAFPGLVPPGSAHGRPAGLAGRRRRRRPWRCMCWTTSLAWPAGGAARWWLHGSLASLAPGCERRAHLVLRRGRAARSCRRWRARSAPPRFMPASHTSRGGGRSRRLCARREADGRRLPCTAPPRCSTSDAVRSQDRHAFTACIRPLRERWRRWASPTQPLPAPHRLQPAAPVASDRLEDWGLLPTHPDWAAGFRDDLELRASLPRKRAWRLFVGGAVARYGTGRNLPGEDGTSHAVAASAFGRAVARAASGTRPRAGGCGADHHTYRRRADLARFLRLSAVAPPELPEQPLRPAFARLPVPRRPCRPARLAARTRPACRSWMPACGSSGRPAGCTTGCA